MSYGQKHEILEFRGLTRPEERGDMIETYISVNKLIEFQKNNFYWKFGF